MQGCIGAPTHPPPTGGGGISLPQAPSYWRGNSERSRTPPQWGEDGRGLLHTTQAPRLNIVSRGAVRGRNNRTGGLSRCAVYSF